MLVRVQEAVAPEPATLTPNRQESCGNYRIWLRNYRRENSLGRRTEEKVPAGVLKQRKRKMKRRHLFVLSLCYSSTSSLLIVTVITTFVAVCDNSNNE